MTISIWVNSREKDRGRVAASGDASKAKDYEAAETREALGHTKLGVSIMTGDPVNGAIAVKEIWDATTERWDILGSVED